MDYNIGNGHIGICYDLKLAWRILTSIYGPTMVLGVDHISGSGFLIGLEGSPMLVYYGDLTDANARTFYPMINLKIGKLLKRIARNQLSLMILVWTKIHLNLLKI